MVQTKYSLWPSCSNRLVIMSGDCHVSGRSAHLQKELYAFRHGFLFQMAQLVGGVMSVMHSQLLVKVDRIEN